MSVWERQGPCFTGRGGGWKASGVKTGPPLTSWLVGTLPLPGACHSEEKILNGCSGHGLLETWSQPTLSPKSGSDLGSCL